MQFEVISSCSKSNSRHDTGDNMGRFSHHFLSSKTSAFSKKEEICVTAFYLTRLLGCSDLEITKELLSLFLFCHPQGTKVLRSITIRLKLAKPTRAESANYEKRDWLDTQENQFLRRMDDDVDEDDFSDFILKRLKQKSEVAPQLKAALLKEIQKELQPQSGDSRNALPPRYQLARTLIRQMFTMSDKEIDLCELLVSLTDFGAMDDFFNDELRIRMFTGRKALQQMLALDDMGLHQILKHLVESDIIRLDESDGEIHLADALHQFWRIPDLQALEKEFLGPAPEQTHPLKEYRLNDDDVRHISRLLTTYATDDPKQAPVNILLYGLPGTGKSTFAVSLAKELGLRLIVPRDPESGSARCLSQLLASCSLAHSIASRGEKVVLLVDEADSIFNTNDDELDMSFLGFSFPKSGTRERSLMHTFLEHTKVPIIWICNKIGGMGSALMRRFAYSIEFPKADADVRVNQWRYLVRKAEVETLLPNKTIKELARTFDIPVGVMAQSIDHCRRLYPDNRKEFTEGVRRMCASFEKRCSGGSAAGREKKKVEGTPSYYDPNAVCLKGGSTEVQPLLRRLKNADERIRRGSSVDAAACTMLFYGPPGTGKSALARYLAEKLGRQSMLIHASDILSCWVGNSEKNIAHVFEAAASSGKVLIFDEVDTFLQSRQGASRSWEVTQVNEFLTRLENFHGILIATTNNINQLDTASLRRFAAKVEFAWLSAESCASLYKAMLSPLSGQHGKTLSAQAEARLRAMAGSEPGLTPGDFRTVRSTFMFESPKDCTEERMLDALEAELNVKSEGRQRKISGFSA